MVTATNTNDCEMMHNFVHGKSHLVMISSVACMRLAPGLLAGI